MEEKKDLMGSTKQEDFFKTLLTERYQDSTKQGIFWMLLADCLLLGWIRCQPVEAPFVTIGQISPFVFFVSGSKTLGLD
jgi:hypothetical protein